MPRMDEPNESDSLAKLLLIADGKLGKTYYAGLAALAGFNVLYFDGDVGRPTLAGLPLEARRRIYAIDCADTLRGGIKDSRFIETMQEFIKNSTFQWNDTHGRIALRADYKDNESEIWEIKPGKMDHTCVFVLDSWTGLGESMMTAAGNAFSVDLGDATTTEMRPVYQAGGLKSAQVLQAIRSMRCHVIVLAHPDEYSHTTKPEGKKIKDIKETELVVDWTKMIPKSTSKPNSLTMGKYFTDIAWMETNATGSERLLDFRISDKRISGGHFTERKNSDEYSFANLVKKLGGTVPSETPPVDHWLRILTPEDRANEPESLPSESPLKAKPGKVLEAAGETRKVSGMSSLMGLTAPKG